MQASMTLLCLALATLWAGSAHREAPRGSGGFGINFPKWAKTSGALRAPANLINFSHQPQLPPLYPSGGLRLVMYVSDVSTKLRAAARGEPIPP